MEKTSLRSPTVSLTPSAKRKKGDPKTVCQNLQRVISALEKTSEHLASETDVRLILSKIASTLGRALGAKYVNFWDYTADRKSIYITAAYGMQAQYIEHSKKFPLKLGTAWVGRAMKTGKAWSACDVPKDPLLPPAWLPAVKKQNYHGLLCVPLIRKGEIVGGMCIYFKNIHIADSNEMSLVTIAANQAATAVANAKLVDELLTEKNKTTAIIQSLKDGLIMYNLENKIVLFNKKAEELLSMAAKNVVNQEIDQSAAQRDQAWKNLYEITRLAIKEYDIKEYAASGPQKLTLEITHIPVKERYEKIGSVRILRDISREKEIEAMKTNFISIASHQLRTPLSAIKWALDSLLQEEYGNLTAEQTDLLAKTFQTNENLINLVHDLLDVSKVEEGKFHYEFKLDDVARLVKKIAEEQKKAVAAKRIKLTLKLPAEPIPKISLDEEKLKMAIQNVLDNAIKYTLPDGNIDMELKTEPTKKSVFLTVEDNGIGIPEKKQALIFNKFFRANNAIRLQTEGSGLGLYIAKRIADKHNANLFFESRENKGSVFTFRFPLSEEEMPKSAS